MIKIVGYQIEEQIHVGRRSTVYLGRRESDGLRVVIKVLDEDRPSAAAIGRMRSELAIGQSLAGAGAVPYIGIEPARMSLAIVMEDIGARALRATLDVRRLSIEEALGLGAAIAARLAQIHKRQVVHKDINPANIVVHPVTREVALIDFGLATRIARETPSAESLNVLEGTLRYMSPEQTGRINRTVDHRTDLYALGVTLYEMLVGRVPFSSSDAAELCHLHIAARPVPPREVDRSIPRAVSAVVMKLLAKTAEDRYQTASGLEADLRAILADVAHDPPGFTPGLRDVASRLSIPEKLYGRDAEIAVLVGTFERARRGRAELVLVSGEGGVGKSALVSQIHAAVHAAGGYFVSGKFDEKTRDVPYVSLIQAVSDLVRQILTEREAELARWRARMREALGESGDVITQVIPNVALIVGDQPPVPQLSAAESEARFGFVVRRFVRSLASEGAPLVLFLDDLQWADRASLELVERLIAAGDVSHLLIVGAHREHEIGLGHPLTSMVDALSRAGRAPSRLSLAPLGAGHVEQMIADALGCDRARAAPLAKLVFDRTEGNPLFVGQLLRALHEEGRIYLDEGARDGAKPGTLSGVGWRWDIDAIRAHGLTSDVAELMARKIEKLSPASREVIELAACIGPSFDLMTLALVRDKSPADTARDLEEAIVAGLVIARDGRHRLAPFGGASDAAYRFLHDRVRESAYARLAEDRRGEIHLRIGRSILAATPEPAREARLFDIVSHLDLGPIEGRSIDERLDDAWLDLRAGRKAKASAAYGTAQSLFEAGLRLLPEEAWREDRALAFGLHAEAMEAEYLNGNVERGDARSTALLERATDAIEKVRIREARASAYMRSGELDRARDEGYAALDALGLDLPRSIDLPGFFDTLRRTQERIGARRAEDLMQLRRMTDPRFLAAARVALMLVPPLFMASPLLCLAVQLEALLFCLDHGNAPEAPYLYATYGMILTIFLGDMDNAATYGRMSLALVDRLDAKRLRAKVHMLVSAFVLHWKAHVRETIPLLVSAVNAGLESGDLEFMGYAAGHVCTHRFTSGEPLDVMLREHDRYLELLDRHALTISSVPMRIERQACLCLAGRAKDPKTLTGESFDEAEIAGIIEAKNYSTASHFFVQKTMLGYLFHDYAAAVASAEAEDAFVAAQVGLVATKAHNFYQSLALLAAYATASPEDREKHLAKVEKNQADAKRWSDHAPMSTLHRFELVEAERARVRGDHNAASSLYEDAARHAREGGYLQDEALAHELAGAHHRSLGRDRLARDCFLDAAAGYRRWGAEALVAELEARHPDAFVRFSSRGPLSREIDPGASTATDDSDSVIDLRTVLKAARAVSGELVLDRLLDNLMRFAAENAGADRGFLVLSRDGAFTIEAARAAVGEEPIALPRALAGCGALSEAMVQYAARTGETVIFDDAAERGLFTSDPYVARRRPRSVLCAPIQGQGRVAAIMYLENNLTAGAFTTDRLEILKLITSQAALSIQNAMLYEQLEQHSEELSVKVEERTRELSAKNEELYRTLAELRDMQAQLVTQEKLASLGALTAGIAHEIKNPLNFVTNFAELSSGLAEEIVTSVSSQRSRMDEDVVADFDEAMGALRENLVRINQHGRRANHIIDGMLMHSRESAGSHEPADLNALLAESINLTYHGLRGQGRDLNISIDAEYDPAVGAVEVVPGDVSRVFVNVINNACHALAERKKREGNSFSPKLTVRTQSLGDRVEVTIHDNGTGVPTAILGKIFHPFFTTKAPGEGTGLGLSISHDIIVGGHQGTMTMDSVEGRYAEVHIVLPRRRG